MKNSSQLSNQKVIICRILQCEDLQFFSVFMLIYPICALDCQQKRHFSLFEPEHHSKILNNIE